MSRPDAATSAPTRRLPGALAGEDHRSGERLRMDHSGMPVVSQIETAGCVRSLLNVGVNAELTKLSPEGAAPDAELLCGTRLIPAKLVEGGEDVSLLDLCE